MAFCRPSMTDVYSSSKSDTCRMSTRLAKIRRTAWPRALHEVLSGRRTYPSTQLQLNPPTINTRRQFKFKFISKTSLKCESFIPFFELMGKFRPTFSKCQVCHLSRATGPSIQILSELPVLVQSWLQYVSVEHSSMSEQVSPSALSWYPLRHPQAAVALGMTTHVC